MSPIVPGFDGRYAAGPGLLADSEGASLRGVKVNPRRISDLAVIGRCGFEKRLVLSDFLADFGRSCAHFGALGFSAIVFIS